MINLFTITCLWLTKCKSGEMGIDLSKFKFEFNSAIGIMYKYYFGEISFQDIVSSWEYAIKNNLIPKENKGFLVDFTKANLTSYVSEYQLISDFFNSHPEIFGHKKIAVITVNPRDIVVPFLIKHKKNEFATKPFSTIEAAIKWILE